MQINTGKKAKQAVKLTKTEREKLTSARSLICTINQYVPSLATECDDADGAITKILEALDEPAAVIPVEEVQTLPGFDDQGVPTAGVPRTSAPRNKKHPEPAAATTA